MQCLILAGGRGTRMDQWTQSIPKALIPVHRQPFAHYQLQQMAQQGIRNIVYSIGYLGDQIREYVGSGSRWGIQVKYVDEGDQLRGTAGAIRKAIDEDLLDEDFFVLYGDAYLSVDYAAIWKHYFQHSGKALVTVLRNNNQWDQSNTCYQGGKISLYQKNHPAPKPPEMSYIDYGLSLFNREWMKKHIPSSAVCDLGTLYHQFSLQGELLGYEVYERFYEIGSPSGLKDFQNYLDSSQTR